MIHEIIITQCYRTSIGNSNGSLSRFSAAELGKVVLKKILTASNIKFCWNIWSYNGASFNSGSGQSPAR